MLAPLYRLLLRQQITRGRLLLIAGATAGLLVITFAMNRALEGEDRTEVVVGFLSVVSLGLVTPILSLVFASSALGQLVEDDTLVYLWLRPYSRWQLAVAAFGAAVTAALPATVIPAALGAAVGTGADGAVVAAVAGSTALAALAYSALFVFLGVLLRRSLELGLVYIFIWELFVARAGAGAARLSINSYPASVLARALDLDLPQAERSSIASYLVPLLIVPVGVALTTWWLNRMEVA